MREIDYALGRFDSNSVRELRDVDVRLATIVLVAGARYHAAFPSGRRLRVTSGRRTTEEQEALVRDGKSRTMNSHHLDGRAVDLAIIERSPTPQWDGSKVRAIWDLREFQLLDNFMQKAATDIGFEPGDLLWGGHWTSLRDGSHWQLMLPPL